MSSKTRENGFQDGVRDFGILDVLLDADDDLRDGYRAGQAALQARPELIEALNYVYIMTGKSGEAHDPETNSEEENEEIAEMLDEIESTIAAIPRQ